MIQLSEVSKQIKPSLTRKLFDMAKNYQDVIDFTLGDPDIPPYEDIKSAACSAIMQGKTRYSQNAGLIDLRNAIGKYYDEREALLYDPQKEIIVTVGAMEGLFLALISILNPGDEVIIPAPYWINYQQMVFLCHANPVIVDSDEDGDLTISVNAIKSKITSKTKIIILNTPNNPSGLIISQSKLSEIAKLAITNDLIVISDEVYKTMMYDGSAFRSIVHFDGMRERTVLVNSFSKEFCMTGWRIGYILAPDELISTMTKLQENIVACAPLPSQYAAIEALRGGDNYSRSMVNEYRKRRDVLVEGLNKIKKLSCKAPDATFYLMLNIKETGLTSEEFAYKLLEEVQVAVVPGITYGKNCEGYVRLAFTISMDKIKEGLERIDNFIKKIS
jgi:aminotransferase